MKIDLHNYVDFQADFRHPSSIDEPSGEELAAILAEDLPRHGIIVLKTEGSDFAHYVECESGSSTIELMVGAETLGLANCRSYILPFTKRTFFGHKTVLDSDYRTLFLAVNEVLHASERISDIRWYPEFEGPEYLALTPHSPGPIPEADFGHAMHPLIRFDRRLERVISAIYHPFGMFGFFVLTCILIAIAPEVGIVIATILFFTALALMTVVPFGLSILVRREAKRISTSGG